MDIEDWVIELTPLEELNPVVRMRWFPHIIIENQLEDDYEKLS